MIAWRLVAGLLLLIRASIIGSESVDNIMQQQLQSTQWLGFGLLVIAVLLVEIAVKMGGIDNVKKP